MLWKNDAFGMLLTIVLQGRKGETGSCYSTTDLIYAAKALSVVLDHVIEIKDWSAITLQAYADELIRPRLHRHRSRVSPEVVEKLEHVYTEIGLPDWNERLALLNVDSINFEKVISLSIARAILGGEARAEMDELYDELKTIALDHPIRDDSELCPIVSRILQIKSNVSKPWVFSHTLTWLR